MNSPLRDAVDGATICAISTAPGAGGIAVVRISGKDALALGSKVFSKPLDAIADRSVAFGRFRDAEGTVLDEGLALILRGPGSYTGEDTVEFNIHGSQFIQREVMRALIEAGCRQAGPGEFTQRAFLNGRLDLTQAEAVADLIAAEHAGAHRLALDQLRGGFAREINALREALIGFAGLLELELDFAEEDVEFADRERFDALLADLLSRVGRLADSFATGNAMKEGIPVAIVGAPNRGKSTLLNALLGDDRAIVSDIPGTTRDTVEDACTLDGLRFRFIDTAGLRDTDDVVEAEGIRRALAKASSASTVLLLLDASTDAHEDVQARIDALELDPRRPRHRRLEQVRPRPCPHRRRRRPHPVSERLNRRGPGRIAPSPAGPTPRRRPRAPTRGHQLAPLRSAHLSQDRAPGRARRTRQRHPWRPRGGGRTTSPSPPR